MKNIFNKNGNSSSTSTIISLSLVLFVVGLLAFVLINANKVSDKMKESIVFSIMLYDSTDDTSEEIILNRRAEFNNYLDGSGYFLDVTFIDKEIAFANLQEDMGEDFSSVLGSNPLLDSYEAYVKAEFVSPNGLKEIEDFINTFKGSDVVQDIFYQRNLVEKLNSNVKNISDTRRKDLFLDKEGKIFFEKVYESQKKRIYDALKTSESDSVIKFKEMLNKIINGKK